MLLLVHAPTWAITRDSRCHPHCYPSRQDGAAHMRLPSDNCNYLYIHGEIVLDPEAGEKAKHDRQSGHFLFASAGLLNIFAATSLEAIKRPGLLILYILACAYCLLPIAYCLLPIARQSSMQTRTYYRIYSVLPV
ncbi:hypothetical protein V8C34DRAFT_224966 [Trichoderma compactum]